MGLYGDPKACSISRIFNNSLNSSLRKLVPLSLLIVVGHPKRKMTFPTNTFASDFASIFGIGIAIANLLKISTMVQMNLQLFPCFIDGDSGPTKSICTSLHGRFSPATFGIDGALYFL